MSALRSRKSFRWMSAPVLWHNVEHPASAGEPGTGFGSRGLSRASTDAVGTAFGRGLYGRKLRRQPDRSVTEPTETEAPLALGPRPRTFLRWQSPLSYLVIWQAGGFTLTWHAPWCKHCDCVGAGWRFARDAGYLAGLGFELSTPTQQD